MNSVSIHIIIVSNDGTSAWLMSQTLSDEGFLVDTAATQEEGRKHIRDNNYNLIIFDLNNDPEGKLPIIDEIPGGHPVPPVIILTESTRQRAVIELLKKYPGDYIIKDPDRRYIDILSLIVEKTIDRHHLVKEKEETEQALIRVSHEKLAILNSMSEMVLFLDADLSVVWANNSITQTIGTSQKELQGLRCFQILMNGAEPCAGCPIERIKDTMQPQNAEITTTDGRIWYISGYPMLSENGDLEGIVEMKQDITEKKVWEGKLKQASDEWRATFDSIVDFVAINDTNFRLIKVNRTFADFFGASPKEIIGRTCYDLFYGRPDPCPECPQKIKHTGSQFTYRERRFGDHIQISASPILSDTQETLGYVTIGKDISQQQKSERALMLASTQWRTTFDSIVDPISIIDRDFRVVKANLAFSELIEKRPKEIIAKTCYKILHGRSKPCEHCPQPVAHETKTTAITSYLDNTKKRHIQISCSPIMDEGENIIGYVNIKTDITEQKKEKDDLQKYSGHLKKMVGQLSQELKDAQTQIIEKSQQKAQRQLAGRIGIEMKRSLGTINRALQKEKSVMDDAKNKDAVTRLGKQLERMTSNLLFYADERPPKREEIVLSELIARILERDLPPDAINLSLNISFDIPYVFVDPYQMEQAIDNIIINAMESMSEGGDLMIKAEKKGKGVCLTISDTGPGIPPKVMKRLFDPLFTTKSNGIGIGMTIAKKLIESNGGTLGIENNNDKGCTVSIVLPTTAGMPSKDDIESLF